MPTVAPYAATYTARIPYITTTEWLQSATGVSSSQLVPGGTSGQQTAALTTNIARASSWADAFCHQVLAATAETENGELTTDRWGRWVIHPAQHPVQQVTAFSYTPTPGGVATTVDVSTAWVERNRIIIPAAGALTTTAAGSLQFGAGGPLASSWATWSYVAGWPNTTLTAAAAAGATTVTVADPTGIITGQHLTFYDADLTEAVTVAAVAGSSVTFTGALTNAHAAGTALSALPPAVKQAVVFLTTALIKARGSEALVMSSLRGEPRKQAKIEDGGLEEIDLAFELLTPFQRVF